MLQLFDYLCPVRSKFWFFSFSWINVNGMCVPLRAYRGESSFVRAKFWIPFRVNFQLLFVFLLSLMYKCVLMSRAPWASSNLNAKMNSYLQKLLWHNDMLSRIERRDNYFKCDSFSSAALVFGERTLVSEASERGWLTYWFGKFKGDGGSSVGGRCQCFEDGFGVFK